MNNFFYFLLAPLLIALAGCATQQAQISHDVSVAIWDLEDLSPSGSPYPDMGELLSARVIQTFKDTDRYTVVERERLLLALEELNLGTTALVDESSRLRLGRLVGARFMVFGGYMVIGKVMRLDLRLVNVESGAIAKTSYRISSATDISAWIKAAADAAAELL